MLTLLHASDLHFGEPYRPEVGEALRRAALDMAPDVLVLSGDFTQRAKVAEYQAARAFLDSLPDVPRVVTPGNHDVPLYRVFERALAPYGNYRAHIQDELDTVTRVEGAVIVALNSSAPHHAIVNGRISPEQVDFAAEAFDGAPEGAARVMVTHHLLAFAPDDEADARLPRAREILTAFHDMGVELVLSGHLHRGFVASSLDVVPEVDSHAIVMAYSGTTTSSRGRGRERGRNSFNRVRVDRDRVEVTRFLHRPADGCFTPDAVHVFPRGSARPGWAQQVELGGASAIGTPAPAHEAAAALEPREAAR
ncbi:MAG TPA: metallophosphoesterase [Longimicrobiales bacterium]